MQDSCKSSIQSKAAQPVMRMGFLSTHVILRVNRRLIESEWMTPYWCKRSVQIRVCLLFEFFQKQQRPDVDGFVLRRRSQEQVRLLLLPSNPPESDSNTENSFTRIGQFCFDAEQVKLFKRSSQPGDCALTKPFQCLLLLYR